MPGPGAHLLYALSGGEALSWVSGHGRFGPHHCAVYAANAFLGPDLGAFAEWLSSFLPSASAVGGLAMAAVHHPFYYPLLLGSSSSHGRSQNKFGGAPPCGDDGVLLSWPRFTTRSSSSPGHHPQCERPTLHNDTEAKGEDKTYRSSAIWRLTGQSSTSNIGQS
ncbi:hypothetical protein EJB05_37587, partial [Eragrostis curvula]